VRKEGKNLKLFSQIIVLVNIWLVLTFLPCLGAHSFALR